MLRKLLSFLCLFLLIVPGYAKTILVLGDSLSAAYGMQAEQGWVNLLKLRLQKEAYPYQVINYSTSGDTTGQGLKKLPQALAKYKPDIIIIELGANDGLQRLPISKFKANLEQLIAQSQQKSAKVLLLATLLPPNDDSPYLMQYKQVYVVLAKQYQTQLIPMFLEGIAGDPAYVLSDGLHPNQVAQIKILDNVWPVLKQML